MVPSEELVNTLPLDQQSLGQSVPRGEDPGFYNDESRKALLSLTL